MRRLFDTISAGKEMLIAKFKGFGSCSGTQDLFFLISESEVIFVLIDTNGNDAELADEEKFNGEEPLWFSESSHRVSPFSQVRTLTLAFRESMRAICGNDEKEYLSVLISNTHIINYADYVDVFDELKGAVFFDVQDIDIKVRDERYLATELMSKFRECCVLSGKLYSLFEPYESLLNDKPSYIAAHSEPNPVRVSDFLEEKELDDFFSLEDPDFKRTKEVANVETGERVVVKNDAELPVSILEPLADPNSLLSEMVGLDELKSSMSEIVAYARYAKRVKEAYPEHAPQPVNLHTIIVGNAGTGKTTMCRVLGGLLHKAGVLSRGHTVVASRSTFIGQHFGVEEERMRQALRLAQGGCLFIDEAGQLFDNAHPHDPGRGVLQLMLQLLGEEENRDIAVVLALYANDKSLQRLYDLNPGIKSRFVNVLTFPDYSLPELQKIALKKTRALGLTFTPNAWRKFCVTLKAIYEHKDRNYGNAREVVNLLQRCVIKHAVRCERLNITGQSLLRLTVRDIPDHQPTVMVKRLGFN